MGTQIEERSKSGGPIWGLVRIVLTALIVLALGSVGSAAAAPLLTIDNPLTGSVTNASQVPFKGTTTDPVDPITLEIYQGTSAAGTPVQAPTTLPAPLEGTWSAAPLSALPDGTYTAVAEQSELAETGSSNAVTFTVITSPPTVTLDQPTSPSNDATPTFAGSASDTTPVTIQIYSGPSAEGTVVSNAAATRTAGPWTSGAAGPPLASGQYTAIARQESSLGNPTGVSESRTFWVDTSSPTVTLEQPASPSNNTSPVFTGTASETTPVVVHVFNAGNTEVASATATGTGGSWTSGVLSPALTSGTYTATATQASRLGNPSGASTSVSFTVDTEPPRVNLEAPALRSSNTTPSFTGTASDSTPVTVRIYAGARATGEVISSATAEGTGGQWTSTNAGPPLANGSYTAVATQASSLGNPDGVSSERTFTVDTTSPRVTLEQPPPRSRNTSPTFTGSADDTTPVTVHIYAGTSASGAMLASVAATVTAGAWLSSNVSPPLPNGVYTAVATQPSSLGNPAGVSDAKTFTVDTTSPIVTLTAPQSPSNTLPAFTGTASDSTPVTVSIYAGASPTGPALSIATTTPSGANWSVEAAHSALPSGQYTALATQESSLGNPAGHSEPRTFKLDTTSPTVVLNAPPSPSNNYDPSFTGTASDTTPVTIRIYAGGNAEGPVVSTATATHTGGGWSSSKAKPALSSGKHTYSALATQESSLGNPTGVSRPVAFTVDTTPPTVTLSAPISPSNDNTPSFTGTSSDTTPVVIRVYEATTSHSLVATVTALPSGGVWTSGKAILPAGRNRYTATATQASSIGNPAGTSEAQIFTVDTLAPSVTLSAPPPLLNSPTPSFTGTASDTTPVTVEIHAGSASGPVVASATAAGTRGGWSSGVTEQSLADGQYTAQAFQESSLPGTHRGASSFVGFTVDTVAPSVGLSFPADGATIHGGSELVQGTAGGGQHDLPSVTVRLFSGPAITVGEASLQSIVVTPVGGAWSATFAGLSVGTYSVRAEQSDEAGNLGLSSRVSFRVEAPSAGAVQTSAPPVASFEWFPSTPQVGEHVSLASSSTDPGSPITSFGWDLAGNGPFAAGAQLLGTSFSTAGRHTVRLRVTDARGMSSIATETIPVTARRFPVLRPFPTVRIVSTRSGSTVLLKVLAVHASTADRVAVRCVGRGCPVALQQRSAKAGGVRMRWIEFRRLERALRPGVVIEVRIWKAGEIGSFTRFAIRRARAPERLDTCLSPAGVLPITCPAS